MDNKCGNNFESQYAYIDNKHYSITEYTDNEILKQAVKRKMKYLKCSNNHELIYVEGKKIMSYFRHKNNTDIVNYNNISDWHKIWSSQFEIREKYFPKGKNNIKDRKADAYIEKYNIVIEFQHSNITET